MVSLSADVSLRPLRVALLADPEDRGSIAEFMQVSSTIWGGYYNSIVPVCEQIPSIWNEEFLPPLSGRELAQGYIRFFEPDIFVAANEDLIPKAGLEPLLEDRHLEKRLILLRDMLAKRSSDQTLEPTLGVSMLDVQRDLYRTEKRFKLKNERNGILVGTASDAAVSEILFGVYPKHDGASYFYRNFSEIFEVESAEPEPTLWVQVYLEGDDCPIQLTRYRIKGDRFGPGAPTIFLFDPKNAYDVVDAQNIRSEESLYFPLPIDWLEMVEEELIEFFGRYRSRNLDDNDARSPVKLEFARSISDERRNDIVASLNKRHPKTRLSVKNWRNRVWVPQSEGAGPRFELAKPILESEFASMDGEPETKRFYTFRLPPLAPEFASEFGIGKHRWANVVRPYSVYQSKVPVIFPYSAIDGPVSIRGSGNEPATVGNYGWSFLEGGKSIPIRFSIPTHASFFEQFFRHYGASSRSTEPGAIATQILRHLKGIPGLSMIAHPATLKLLNKMAGGIRVRKLNEDNQDLHNVSGLEEITHFDPKARKKQYLTKELHRINPKSRLIGSSLDDYISRNVFRLGLETKCPSCGHRNWHQLPDLEYSLDCSRCLADYAFPQARDKTDGVDWSYRTIGPFAVPDFARGAYAALLAIRAISEIGPRSDGMAFVNATELDFGDEKAELDFACLHGEASFHTLTEPTLIVGEAKSFGGGETLRGKDIEKLKLLAERLPNCTIAVAVLRDHLVPEEVDHLNDLLLWIRRRRKSGASNGDLLILTGNELFHDYSITKVWEELGGKHAERTEFSDTRTLSAFCASTQYIYLNSPHYYDDDRLK